ncbi:hypothetical protein SmJEL517_g00529 [Synchytrium microbalum]|uniref:Acyl-CoA desaturase n=1 Tax=Synchytrium microbalum TaxID=1806994 RepID=A0A507CHF5_9FUNG|nr:uncharacterized protein SmJEL517_g00529 [Synchytrium microbalum]TPX37506.1 hypothetical protein SmJEL517_g00529 [Synchytrium microbalum]
MPTLGQRMKRNDIEWLNVVIFIVTPALSLYGFYTTQLTFQTAIWAVVYYFCTGLAITAGTQTVESIIISLPSTNPFEQLHRYFAHRSYEAAFPMRLLLALFGAGALQGSIKWWCRDHRAHHRYTDSSRDPYGANKGVFWSHIGWLVVKQDKDKIGRVDISDLKRDKIVMWQHDWFPIIGLFMAFVFPTLVAYIGWGDFWGGFYFAGVARLVVVHHATFCVNSLAHWLGEASYDDRQTPRDHFITALVTLGEGYHNFHHEFPSDYRNAILFWQYDPTKWTIWICSLFGLTYNLKMFPENEIVKGRIQMQEKKIDELKKKLNWGKPLDELPEWTWKEFALKKDGGQNYLVVDKIVYNVHSFMEDHPGGRGFLKTSIGRDVSASFNGAIYFHSNAARNLATRMRIAKIVGEIPDDEKAKEE